MSMAKPKSQAPARGTKAFEKRAAEATGSAIAARDKFAARLRAVDPALVDAFQECLSAMLGPLQALNAELGDETRRVRASIGKSATKKTKSKERAR